ncbi:MAG TPA: glycosyltransferase family 2 protein, partial [Bacteroidota bacterium]|nr:glycosyltransferase family 2 protein [Bacteroidota bacterium]
MNDQMNDQPNDESRPSHTISESPASSNEERSPSPVEKNQQGGVTPPVQGERKPQRDRRFKQQRQRPAGNRFEQRSHADGNKEVSIVVPLYNEEQSLPELYEKLKSVLNRHGRYEIWFIDDGSTDGSIRVLQDLRQRDRRVKIIRFRRNYGKSAALSVGFLHASGDIVITLDADLQDDPEEIP